MDQIEKIETHLHGTPMEKYNIMPSYFKIGLILSPYEWRYLFIGITEICISVIPVLAYLNMCTFRGLMSANAAPMIAFLLIVIPGAIAKNVSQFIWLKAPGINWKKVADRIDESLGMSQFPVFLGASGFIMVFRMLIIIVLRILQTPLVIGKPYKAFRLNYSPLIISPAWDQHGGMNGQCTVWWHDQINPFIPKKDEDYEVWEWYVRIDKY